MKIQKILNLKADNIIRRFLKSKNYKIYKTNYIPSKNKIEYFVKDGTKYRLIIVQILTITNYKKEFKRKRISKKYIKKEKIIKNAFSYIAVNNIKGELSLDLIQIYLNGETKKIKYRKNIDTIRSISELDLLGKAI